MLAKLFKESKQVGVLYHVCRPSSMLWNLKNNKLAPSGESVSRAVNKRGKKHFRGLYLLRAIKGI